MTAEVSRQISNSFIERVKRACEAGSLEPGVWYVKGKPTDALTYEEATNVANGRRKPIEWINLEK